MTEGDRPIAGGGEVSEALEALEAGDAFAAHERFEDAWRGAVDPDLRSGLKGLAQLAAALVKAGRGHGTGHAKLWRKSRARLEGVARVLKAVDGVDLGALVAAMPAEPPDPPWSPPRLARACARVTEPTTPDEA